MDKSKLYAKMSEKAVEVQEALRKQMGVSSDWGDWCATHNRPFFDHNDRYSPQLEGKCRPIIRPRQDQLQGMLGFGLASSIIWFSDFATDWLDAHDYPNGVSMEQLWLAFVMKEKYNKTWDGEEWLES